MFIYLLLLTTISGCKPLEAKNMKEEIKTPQEQIMFDRLFSSQYSLWDGDVESLKNWCLRKVVEARK